MMKMKMKLRVPPLEETPRLRDLSTEQDLLGVAAMIHDASAMSPLSEVSRHRIRGRLRRSLSAPAARERLRSFALRPVVVVAALLASAGIGGAAVRIVDRRRHPIGDEAAGADRGSPARPIGHPRRVPRQIAIATPAPPAELPAAPMPLEAELSAPAPPPTVTPVPAAPTPGSHVKRPVASASAGRSPRVSRVASSEAPAPRTETAILAYAIQKLRGDGDASAALVALDEHRARFPAGPLALEATGLRIEALLKAGRATRALEELDRFALDEAPGRNEWRVVRGELRAAAGRWRDAEVDFTAALARLGAGAGDLAERALWGRAVAEARSGDVTGAETDYALYLGRFPSGRFAAKVRLARQHRGSGDPSAP
jgi:hypothetical protein